jgi:PIN domain nuclease of toxin-antitoxin system
VLILLDTNVLLKLVDTRLGALPLSVRTAVSDPENILNASVTSLWEIAIKVRLGKLKLTFAPTLLPETLESTAISLLTIDHRHVLADVVPEPTTKDPFDRLLLAQCSVENMRLLTLDRALVGHPLAWRSP